MTVERVSSMHRVSRSFRLVCGRVAWLVDIGTQAIKRFSRHRGDTLGAALAFNTLLALAPLLVVAVAVLARIIGEGPARTETLMAVRQAVGPKGVDIAAGWLDTAREMSSIATAIGTLLFVVGASRFVDGLDVALDVVFEEPTLAEPPPTPWKHEILHFIRDRALHLAVSLGLGLWIAVSLGIRVAMEALWPSSWSIGLSVAKLLLSFSSLVLALAVMYRVLPHRRLAWTDVLFGAVVTAGLQTLGAWLLGLWFTRAQVGAGYGATGTVVAILIFLYASSQVFVLGAELSAELLRRRWARTMRTAI
jgi:membrane protein